MSSYLTLHAETWTWWSSSYAKQFTSLSWTGINLQVHKDSGSSHFKIKINKRRVLLFRVLYSHLLKLSESGRGHIHLEIILLAISTVKMKTSVIFIAFCSLLNSKTCSMDFAAETWWTHIEALISIYIFSTSTFFSVKHNSCLTVLFIQYLFWNFFLHVTMYIDGNV